MKRLLLSLTAISVVLLFALHERTQAFLARIVHQ